MGSGKYKIEYTFSSREDMKRMKKYILDTFIYPELGENFVRKMKAAANELKEIPKTSCTIDFKYRGYDIYLKVYRTYLFFYIVNVEQMKVTVLRILQDGMNWQFILKQWLKENT